MSSEKIQNMPPIKTRREMKREKALRNSEPGITKGESCQATALDKAMAKYPRSRKTLPSLYESWVIKCKKYHK